jgi:Integral membrane protein CcmA involved in cell shape determination
MGKVFDDVSIKTIIGQGSSIKGNLFVSGVMRIDGDVAGDVVSNNCVMIGENARICGNITATSVISRGLVKGNILSETEVRLFSSAVVLGDVFTKKINIQDGVLFEGRCFAVNNTHLFDKIKEEYLNAKNVLF